MQVTDARGLDTVVHENPSCFTMHPTRALWSVSCIVERTDSTLHRTNVVVFARFAARLRHHLLDKYATLVLLAFKDKNARTAIATYALTSASAVRMWLDANRFPSAFEHPRDAFQQVMCSC